MLWVYGARRDQERHISFGNVCARCVSWLGVPASMLTSFPAASPAQLLEADGLQTQKEARACDRAAALFVCHAHIDGKLSQPPFFPVVVAAVAFSLFFTLS